MASCVRDASRDAWGRRVIINRLTGKKPDAAGVPEIGELTFLLQSGSDRIGALDFQISATQYVPRLAAQASHARRLLSEPLSLFAICLKAYIPGTDNWVLC